MSPYGIDKDLGGDSPQNTSWMESCVKKVMNKKDKAGNTIDKSKAIAICKNSFKKSKANATLAEADIQFLLDTFDNIKRENYNYD